MRTAAIATLTADAMRTTALQDLCDLVRDAVSGGASLSWVAVPRALEAATYWCSVADQVHSGALVLDTRTGDPSQHRYAKLGYLLAGMMPHYARGTTGAWQPTSIMYKEIGEVRHHAT